MVVVISHHLPTPFNDYEVKDTSVGIGLIKVTKTFDALSYKPFFKHYILQTVSHVLFCLYLCGKNRFLFGLAWLSMLQF